jgi:hypothetical protein
MKLQHTGSRAPACDLGSPSRGEWATLLHSDLDHGSGVATFQIYERIFPIGAANLRDRR